MLAKLGRTDWVEIRWGWTRPSRPTPDRTAGPSGLLLGRANGLPLLSRADYWTGAKLGRKVGLGRAATCAGLERRD
ncbi:hypothetical protein CRG98_001914 [Punica granatum]|uniref:Uncharacterized protein n=1 Tax=Punica granatum TaxID=22663 RepID=A0A2I0LAH0_PUNGR|nr:hypothetical protein CRG98_001914 [Punica granatum]